MTQCEIQLRAARSEGSAGRTFADAGNGRDNNLGFIRWILAVAVMYSHCFPLGQGSYDGELATTLTGGKDSFGRLAVGGFFILSGFLIAHSWVNSQGLRDFILRRFLRIVPGFSVAVLLSALIGWIVSDQHLTAGEVMKHVIRGLVKIDEPSIPGAFASNPHPLSVNGSLWTIRWEIKCYLMVAVLGIMGLLNNRAVLVLLFSGALLCLLGSQIVPAMPSESEAVRFAKVIFAKIGILKTHRVQLFVYFLAGVCFWRFRARIPNSGLLAVTAVALLVAANFTGNYTFQILLPISGVYLLFWVAFCSSIPFSSFDCRGDFSYGLYLYAFPMTQVIVFTTHARIPIGWLFVASLMATMILAWLSWNFVEKQCLRLKANYRAPRVSKQTLPPMLGRCLRWTAAAAFIAFVGIF